MLKKVNNVFILILLFTVISVQGFSQPLDSNRSVIIKTIRINGKVKSNNGSKIVIASKDSLSLEFGLSADNKSPRDAFLFKIILSTEVDSSVYNSGSTSISYAGLNKNKYTLTIGAFDLQRRWSAKSVVFNFEVDDEEAALIKKLDSINDTNLKLIGKVAGTKPEGSSSNGLFPEKWTIYIIIFLIITVLVLLVILFYRFLSFQKWSIKSNKNKKEKSMQDDRNYISRDEYNRLLTENGSLKAEIAGLRGQIDALMVRGDQLTRQNRELQSSIAKLNNSKDELEDLQRQKDELFAVIIHDIKNPAALIKSLAELLTSYDLTATEQQEIINDIAQTTIKIVSLSQEVSKILSIESSKLVINFEKNNLNEVVNDVSHRNSIAARAKSIHLFCELMENLPDAEFDSQKMDEIIDNLLSNAIKFTPSGGTVRVRTSKELNNIVLEINDNGLGLTEEDLQNTFKRGVRLSAKPTAGEASSGLGLWIVRKLVEAHKGKVWVKSALGKGSTFAFSIPLKQ